MFGCVEVAPGSVIITTGDAGLWGWTFLIYDCLSGMPRPMEGLLSAAPSPTAGWRLVPYVPTTIGFFSSSSALVKYCIKTSDHHYNEEAWHNKQILVKNVMH
jgi:hypothetical protein